MLIAQIAIGSRRLAENNSGNECDTNCVCSAKLSLTISTAISACIDDSFTMAIVHASTKSESGTIPGEFLSIFKYSNVFTEHANTDFTKYVFVFASIDYNFCFITVINDSAKLDKSKKINIGRLVVPSGIATLCNNGRRSGKIGSDSSNASINDNRGPNRNGYFEATAVTATATATVSATNDIGSTSTIESDSLHSSPTGTAKRKITSASGRTSATSTESISTGPTSAG
jgi:hypothetical protein